MRLTEITKELFDYLVKFRQRVAQASVPDLNVVRHEIELVFYSMEEKISKHPKLAKEYRTAKYALVVLADEVILTSAWSHAKRWEQCLLEKKYYSSNIGGNQFFKLLSKIEQMPASVIMVYFYCLAFGFRGGFSQNDPSLIRLKGRLLQRVMPKRSNADILLPDAYRIRKSHPTRLSKIWKWSHLGIASAVLFAGLLIIQRTIIWPLLIGSSLNSAVMAENDTDTSLTPAPAGLVAGTPTGYTVQLGTFTSETFAIHFSQQIGQKGIESKIYFSVGQDGTQKYLVLTGTYTTQEAALNVMNQAKALSTVVSEMKVLTLEEATGDCIHGCN